MVSVDSDAFGCCERVLDSPPHTAPRRGLLEMSRLTANADGPTWPDAMTLADLVAGSPSFRFGDVWSPIR